MPSFPLDSNLGIEACADLKQHLADHLLHPEPLHLDGSAIERVHSASLQLLYALIRSRQHAGLETCWVGASPILREAARLLGLSTELGLSAPIFTPQPHMELAA